MFSDRKHLWVKLACFLLFAGMLWISVSAAGTLATMTGPDTVLPGERLTLVFSLESHGICGVSGTISYDPDLLTLEQSVCLIPEGWRLEIRGDRFLAYDESFDAPITEMTPLFSLTFALDPDLPEGTEILVLCRDLVVTDGEEDIVVNDAVYSASIPLSVPVTEATEVPVETTLPTQITEPEITEPLETVPMNTVEPADPTETVEEETLPQRTESSIPQQVTVPTAPEVPLDEQQDPGGRMLPAALLCITSGIVLLLQIVRKKQHGE